KTGMSLADLKKLNHDLPDIWATFKDECNGPNLNRFDPVITSLHRFPSSWRRRPSCAASAHSCQHAYPGGLRCAHNALRRIADLLQLARYALLFGNSLQDLDEACSESRRATIACFGGGAEAP